MADIIRPIEPFQLTQGFGGNYEAYKQFGLAGHNGWDLKTKVLDTPKGQRSILSSWLCRHYKTADQGSKGFGKYFEVIVQLNNTWKLTYAHCLSIEAFTTKHEGEPMAISDNTGNSTGAHLHLTVKKGTLITGVFQHDNPNNGYFGAVNPQLFFDELRAFKKGQLDSPAPVKPQDPVTEASPQPETTPEPIPTPEEVPTDGTDTESVVSSDFVDTTWVPADSGDTTRGMDSSINPFDGTTPTTQPEAYQEVPIGQLPPNTLIDRLVNALVGLRDLLLKWFK